MDLQTGGQEEGWGGEGSHTLAPSIRNLPVFAGVGCGSWTMWVVDAGLLEALHKNGLFFQLLVHLLVSSHPVLNMLHAFSLSFPLSTLPHLPHLPSLLSLTSLKLFVFLSLLTFTLLAPLKQILTGQAGVTMDTKNLEKPASLLPVPPSRSPLSVAENRCDLWSIHLTRSHRERQQRIMTYLPNNTFHAGL